VWQFPHPWAAKTALPASGDPEGASAAVVVGAAGGGRAGAAGVVSAGVSPVSAPWAAPPPFVSFAKTSTALSIAIVRITVTMRNSGSPRLPGKSGRPRGITSADRSANAMKTAAVPPRPRFLFAVGAKSPAGTYPTARPIGSVLDGHEPELLAVALDHALEHLPHAGHVELLLGLRLERAVLARDQCMVVAAVQHRHRPAFAEHRGLVERFARRVVLLAVLVSRLRVGRHDDPRLRPVDAGAPRVAGLDEAPVLELERVLSEVPDVPVLFLGVEVERALDRPSAFGDRVADDGRGDAEDLLRPAGDDLLVHLRRPAPHAAVEERRTRPERGGRVVEGLDEGRGVDLRRVGRP